MVKVNAFQRKVVFIASNVDQHCPRISVTVGKAIFRDDYHNKLDVKRRLLKELL